MISLALIAALNSTPDMTILPKITGPFNCHGTSEITYLVGPNDPPIPNTSDYEGIFRTFDAASAYMDVIKQLQDFSKRNPQQSPFTATIKSGDDKLVAGGTLHESPLRVTEFFHRGKRRVMMTKSRFVEAGHKTHWPLATLNYFAGGVCGTVAQARSKSSEERRIIWNIVWITPDKQVMYEFYAEDELDAEGKSGLSAKEAATLAAELATVI